MSHISLTDREDIHRVITVAMADTSAWGQPAWTEAVDLAYTQVTEAQVTIAELTAGTDFADTMAELEDTLDAAGFGGPVVVDPATGTPQPFVDSLCLDAWRTYRDVLRQRLIDS